MNENIFRGEILKEVKYVPKTNQWVVNGKLVLSEGLTETEVMTLQGAKLKNWQFLKSEAKITGKLC
jgi:hypothetical protein